MRCILKKKNARQIEKKHTEEEGENEDKKVGVREYSDKKRAKLKNSNSVDLPLYSSLLVGGIRKQLVELSFVIGNGRFDRYIGIRQELRRWVNAFNLLQNLLNRRMDLRLLISHRSLNPDRVCEDTDISILQSAWPVSLQRHQKERWNTSSSSSSDCRLLRQGYRGRRTGTCILS